jgi:hypothetical protein
MLSWAGRKCLPKRGLAVTKEKPGFWTHRRAFEQVRRGSNIHLLPYSLVSLAVATKPPSEEFTTKISTTCPFSSR